MTDECASKAFPESRALESVVSADEPLEWETGWSETWGEEPTLVFDDESNGLDSVI